MGFCKHKKGEKNSKTSRICTYENYSRFVSQKRHHKDYMYMRSKATVDYTFLK
jgi:copper oxidase (laccase) domain-containing protein